MVDIAGLNHLRNDHFFDNWNTFVDPKRIAASDVNIRQLIDDLIELGPSVPERAARLAVEECVRRFNDLDDDGWICTIERDDIYEQIGRVIDLCGFEYGEDWVGERD